MLSGIATTENGVKLDQSLRSFGTVLGRYRELFDRFARCSLVSLVAENEQEDDDEKQIPMEGTIKSQASKSFITCRKDKRARLGSRKELVKGGEQGKHEFNLLWLEFQIRRWLMHVGLG